MKYTLIVTVLALLCASVLAGESENDITIPLTDKVWDVVFRVESVTLTKGRAQHQHTVFHSVTERIKGLGVKFFSAGYTYSIETYLYDTKTGQRILRKESSNYIFCNVDKLLFKNRTLKPGDEYVFRFQADFHGYWYLVDVKEKEPPTKPSTATE